MTGPALRWVPCELHAHTLHSDGRLTVAELAQEARRLGLEAVALTDHNTISGLGEIAEAERASGVAMIPGMELTTFYGHLLAWGTTTYVEWRSLTRGDVASAIAAIRASGGLAGVAHPFNPGSPFCTGCYWDFDGPDWSQVDFVEVWSEADPWRKPKNRRALQLWNDLLNQGHRVAGVSATDLHAPEPDHLPSVTYLGVRADARDLVEAAKEALRAGRAFSTLGPLLSFSARSSGEPSGNGPGEAIASSAAGDTLLIDVAWGFDGRRPMWEPHVAARAVVVRGNTGELGQVRIGAQEGSASLSLPRAGQRWIRAELHGLARGEEAMIAFSNPIYVE